MKKAIIIHGYNDKSEYLDKSRPSPSNDHWYPWLQRQLALNGIETQTPEMPGFYQPKYNNWKQTLEDLRPDEHTALVGHSCSGGFLVRWLSESDIKVGKVILVAPWINPFNEYVDDIESDFFDFEIDEKLANKTDGVTLFISDKDEESVMKTVEIFKDKIKDRKLIEIAGKGHFVISSMGTEKFPELLEEILK